MDAHLDHTLPILKGPVDAMKNGPVAFKETALQTHPVEVIQKLHSRNNWENKMDFIERVYGQHSAWEKRMDRAALSSFQRLPGGPPSSHVMIDSFLNRDSKVEFEDILGVPHLKPQMSKETFHSLMEAKLGM